MSNSFFISSLEVGYLPFLGSSMLAMLPVFRRPFADVFASVKVGPEIMVVVIKASGLKVPCSTSVTLLAYPCFLIMLFVDFLGA